MDFVEQFEPESRFLDPFCGAGYESQRLHTCGYGVVEIDFSEESLRTAREKNPAITFYYDDLLNFDIGSTLVDEEEAYNHRIRDMIQGTSVSFEHFSEKRIQYAKEGYTGDQKAIEYFGLTKTPGHSEDETPFDDCAPTLQASCEKGYKSASLQTKAPPSIVLYTLVA